MTNQEYNESVSKIIKAAEISALSRPVSSVYEAVGKWDELLEERERDKRIYDNLFSYLSDTNNPLTPENQAKIIELRRTLYPLLLCDLAKSYDDKERFSDEEKVLLEARSLGSKGAEVLLFSLYGEHASEGEEVVKLFYKAFNRVKNIDFFSETVTKEISNERFQCAALMTLANAYLLFEDNANKAHECLSRALETSWPDDSKEHIRESLSHFQKTLFGGYRYMG